MRNRFKKVVSIIVGAVVFLLIIAGMNYEMTRRRHVATFLTGRRALEKSYLEAGMTLIPWDKLNKTEGSREQGVLKYPDKLAEFEGERVYMVGFEVPLTAELNEILLLALPQNCYLGSSPPISHVVEVNMAPGPKHEYTADQGLLVNGILTLHRERGSGFFYSLEEAKTGKENPFDSLTQGMAAAPMEPPFPTDAVPASHIFPPDSAESTSPDASPAPSGTEDAAAGQQQAEQTPTQAPAPDTALAPSATGEDPGQ